MTEKQKQAAAALIKANAVRLRRAEIKRDLKARRITFTAALEDDAVQSMPVYDLLLALPKVGKVQARKLLAKAQITSETTTVERINARRTPKLVAAVIAMGASE